MIKRKILYLLLLVFVFLIYMSFQDYRALITCITVFPFHIYLVYKAYNYDRLYLTLLAVIMLFSQGINSFFFFLNTEMYSETGFNAVGNFDFSLKSYFSSYSIIFVFVLSLFSFQKLFFASKEYLLSHYVKNIYKEMALKVEKMTNTTNKRTYTIDIVICLLSVFLILLSIWMYNNQIGILGMHQKELPYHLTGILYMGRRLFCSFLLVFLYLKSSHKKFSLIVICIYALILGITSASRSNICLLLSPILLERILSKEKIQSVLLFLFLSFLFLITTLVRGFLYSIDGTIVYSFYDLMNLSLESYSLYEGNIIIDFIAQISNRLFGASTIVLFDQYNDISFSDMLNYYLGKPYTDIFPDFAYQFYGLTFNPDLAFGVAFPYPGALMVFSQDNYFYVIIQAFWVVVILHVLEKITVSILNKKINIYIKTGTIAICSYIVFGMWTGESISFVYKIIFLLFIFNITIKVLSKFRKKHQVLD